MIRIAITPAAFEAIKATRPLGSVGFEPEPNAKGKRYVWIDAATVDRLGAMRGPGESYSDAFLRLVAATGSGMEGACAPLPSTVRRRRQSPLCLRPEGRVMLGTAWIDRPVDTRGCTPASTSLPCSMEVQPCPCHLRPVIRLRH
jgi:hypothetical protein